LTIPILALDDSLAGDKSLRTVDADGHMKVAESRISKANVCPYRGAEIPDFERLGLDPAKIYHLYRDPAELAKGAHTFDGKPLLIRHVPISADEPSQELWVGTIGSTSFESPYLVTRPLTVLTQQAIDLIDSNKQRELSAGYRYDAVMEPGTTPMGERYDGRMANIRGNHVAIVSEGRAGHDVHVADELPRSLTPMRSRASRLIEAALVAAGVTLNEQSRLAMDAVIGSDELGLGETPAESVISLDASEMAAAEDAALEEKRKTHGKDAKLDDKEKADCYDKARKAKDKKAKDEAMDQAAAKAVDAAMKDHRKDFNSLGGGGAKDKKIELTQAELDAYVDGKVRTATDSAVKLAVDSTTKHATALAEARDKVLPLVGKVSIALDSAEKVYRFALKQEKIDADTVHESALPALVDMAVSRKNAVQAPSAPIALDEKQTALLDLNAIFASPVQH